MKCGIVTVKGVVTALYNRLFDDSSIAVNPLTLMYVFAGELSICCTQNGVPVVPVVSVPETVVTKVELQLFTSTVAVVVAAAVPDAVSPYFISCPFYTTYTTGVVKKQATYNGAQVK